MQLQARAAKSEAVQQPLLDTAHRVQVLARIHERLRRVDLAAVVNSKEFIGELCDDLCNSIVGLRPVRLDVVVESHNLLQAQALAVGLILNELVTNALKYAFPEDREGVIAVRFRLSGHSFTLEVIDNGTGIPLGDEAQGTGLGRRLVRSMVAQLGGRQTLQSSDEGGTHVIIEFPRSL